MYAYMSVYVLCSRLMPVKARRGSWILLEVELQLLVSCHMGAGN